MKRVSQTRKSGSAGSPKKTSRANGAKPKNSLNKLSTQGKTESFNSNAASRKSSVEDYKKTAALNSSDAPSGAGSKSESESALPKSENLWKSTGDGQSDLQTGEAGSNNRQKTKHDDVTQAGAYGDGSNNLQTSKGESTDQRMASGEDSRNRQVAPSGATQEIEAKGTSENYQIQNGTQGGDQSVKSRGDNVDSTQLIHGGDDATGNQATQSAEHSGDGSQTRQTAEGDYANVDQSASSKNDSFTTQSGGIKQDATAGDNSKVEQVGGYQQEAKAGDNSKIYQETNQENTAPEGVKEKQTATAGSDSKVTQVGSTTADDQQVTVNGDNSKVKMDGGEVPEGEKNKQQADINGDNNRVVTRGDNNEGTFNNNGEGNRFKFDTTNSNNTVNHGDGDDNRQMNSGAGRGNQTTVNMGDGNDRMNVKLDGANHDSVAVNGGQGNDEINLNGMPLNRDSNLSFSGGEGNDTFNFRPGQDGDYTIRQGDTIIHQGSKDAPVVSLDGFENVNMYDKDGKKTAWTPEMAQKAKEKAATDTPATDKPATDRPATDTTNKQTNKDPFTELNKKYLSITDMGDPNQRNAAFQEFLGGLSPEHRAIYQNSYDNIQVTGTSPVSNTNTNTNTVTDNTNNNVDTSNTTNSTPPIESDEHFMQTGTLDWQASQEAFKADEARRRAEAQQLMEQFDQYMLRRTIA
jgi:hypothetical protein